MQKIIDSLEKQYQRIVNLQEKPFYIGIAGYVSQTLRTPFLKTTINQIPKDTKVNKDVEKLNKINGLSFSTNVGLDKTKKIDSNAINEYLKTLLAQAKLTDTVMRGLQLDVAHAWQKIFYLWLLIYDKEALMKNNINCKGKPIDYGLIRMSAELDDILESKENFGNSMNNIGKDSSDYFYQQDEKNREFFVRGDYLNYLTLVHEHLIIALEQNPLKQIVSFPSGETVIYQDGVMYFKLRDNIPASIDFSAPKSRPIIDTFWTLRKRNIDKTLFTGEEVSNIYQELFPSKDESDLFRLSKDISNIRKPIRNKMLQERIKIGYDKKSKKWEFLAK